MNQKFYRLLTSKNYLNLIKLFHKIFGEKFKKELNISDVYNFEIHRLDIIKNLINKYNIKNYLEIGCDKNEVFEFVKVENKVGVDPVSGGNVRMTSDEFFMSNKQKFDLIFIDGLHRYTQVKKDIENSLKVLNDNGIILIHDCMPFSFYDQACPRAQRKWNGDVWKAIVEFRTYKNISTYVGGFDNGVGMIIKNINKNPLKISKKNNSFIKLRYKDYYNNFMEYLNLVDINNFYKIIDDNIKK